MFDISFASELDGLRDVLPGCRLAAYADLSTRMVLRVSAEKAPPREEIDALCNLAAQCLDGPAIPDLFDGEPPFIALAGGPHESQYFIRSLTDPADALIIVVAEPIEQAAVWAAAQELLNRHTSGSEAS